MNFAVRNFLESQETEMQLFSQKMKSLYLADEKCSLMVNFLARLTEGVRNDQTFSSWANIDQVLGCLETHVFSQVYSCVFHPNGESDVMRDQ